MCVLLLDHHAWWFIPFNKWLITSSPCFFSGLTVYLSRNPIE